MSETKLILLTAGEYSGYRIIGAYYVPLRGLAEFQTSIANLELAESDAWAALRTHPDHWALTIEQRQDGAGYEALYLVARNAEKALEDERLKCRAWIQQQETADCLEVWTGNAFPIVEV